MAEWRMSHVALHILFTQNYAMKFRLFVLPKILYASQVGESFFTQTISRLSSRLNKQIQRPTVNNLNVPAFNFGRSPSVPGVSTSAATKYSLCCSGSRTVVRAVVCVFRVCST